MIAPTEDHIAEPTEINAAKALTRKEKVKFWFKRIGWLGFLFFLIKGLLWLFLGKEALEAIFG